MRASHCLGHRSGTCTTWHSKFAKTSSWTKRVSGCGRRCLRDCFRKFISGSVVCRSTNETEGSIRTLTASLEKKRLRDEVRAHLARMEEELESARQLQMSMVPTIFPQPTQERPFEIFAMMEPAREVGGDLYDFFESDDGTLCFLIGDFSGKGVPAALFMARTKNVIRLITRLARSAEGAVLRPADILGMVNQELCQDNAGMMFVTLFYGMIRPDTGELQFCNAGHNPPYRLNGTMIEAVTAPKGRPIGIRANSNYESGRLSLAPGDTLYLYTDGITAAVNTRGRAIF
jgi:serine phosphatase RsbU (regulator of sigma subunit)